METGALTGDRYLEMLAAVAEEKAGQLLDGQMVLKLNPLGLHYLQSRLDSLQELERLRQAAPVDYLRAYVADLGDHRALELLRRLLGMLASVKVVSQQAQLQRDPTPVTLLPFGRLTTLELRGCDLSTSAARGLLQLRPYLRKLICHNSTDALRHVFAERMVESSQAAQWSRLASVSCACNGILVMDDSLRLLPALQDLDLKRNRLTHVSNLRACTRLGFLDLSFNSIQSVSMLHQVASSLTTLVLRFNALTSTRGIDRLYRLEQLDLSHNIISTLAELDGFGSLCFLSVVSLQGNPVTFAPGYRVKAFSALANPHKVSLDGTTMSRLESWKVDKLVANKSKKDGGFGLYAPAVKHGDETTPFEDNNVSDLKAKKKCSRVVVIEEQNEEDRKWPDRPPLVDVASSSLSGEVSAAAAPESKLQQLLRRVKKDRTTDVPSSPARQKSGRRRRVGSSSKSDKPTMEVEQQKQKQKQALEGVFRMEDRPKDGELPSTSSPPHFNTEVLQRRQHLEDELLQLREDSYLPSDSDSSSTSTGEDLPPQLVEAADDEAPTATSTPTSNSLLAEDSCFFDPKWVGSVQQQQEEEESNVVLSSGGAAAVEASASSASASASSGIRKSRQAWRVAPLDGGA